MMKKLLFIFALANVIAWLSACATYPASTGGKLFPNSALYNLNPAPASMSPPNYDSKSPLLDKTYLSTQADYHFTMAETLSYEGQSAKAIEEYKLALVYDPNSVEVHLRLAAEYVRVGMITEAVAQGETAVKLDPKNIDARMLLGGLYAGLQMFEPARAQFQAAINIDPTQSEASVYLGALLAEEGKYDHAITYFKKLAKNPKFQEPEKAYYYIGRIDSQMDKPQYKSAEKALEKALELKPEYPEAALALASLYHTEHKDKQMERLLSSYQNKFGPEHDMAKNLSHYYLGKEEYDKALAQLQIVDGFEKDNLNVKIQIALIMIEEKKYHKAADQLEDILIHAPDSDKVRYYLGAVYEQLNRPDIAVQNYEKIPPSSAYYAESVVHAAHLLTAENKLNAAVKLMAKAVTQEKDIPQLYAYYATLLDQQKNYQTAKDMLTAAVKKFPDNTQLHFFLGTMEDRLGDTKDTIAEMNKVIALDKNHVQALNYLAYTFAELGQHLDEAHSLAQRALNLQPNDGYILDTMGWVYFKKGDTATAIKYLEAAQKAKSDEAIIAEHLGDAYVRDQLWGKAQQMYRKAASLEHDHVQSQALMRKIANLQNQDQQAGRMPASLPKGTH